MQYERIDRQRELGAEGGVAVLLALVDRDTVQHLVGAHENAVGERRHDDVADAAVIDGRNLGLGCGHGVVASMARALEAEYQEGHIMPEIFAAKFGTLSQRPRPGLE